MSAEEKQEFTFIWKIKNYDKIQSLDFPRILSPTFEVEFLKDIEWNLVLMKWRQILFCSIIRGGCDQLPERIPIDYHFELTTSAGDVLKTSDILSHTFRKDVSSRGYQLMELDASSTPEDVCLRCRMAVPFITPSCPCSVVRWQAETDIVNANHPFELSLKFSDSNKWSAVETVNVENIPIDITFKYVKDELQIELFSKIEDKTFHFVGCGMVLINGKPDAVIKDFFRFTFSKKSGVWQFPSPIGRKLLRKANCFSLKKINVKMVFRYEYNSSISEIKSLNGETTTVKDTALTLNEDEACNLLYLQQNLREMLNDETYADVKLSADDEVFLAHKCLLASRSPVFKAMFDQDMLESKTNTIDIHDVEAKTLKYFLEYLYTGTVDDMDDEIALSLLVVADKYQVSPLTDKCSAFLKSALSIGNVLHVLVVADMVNQEQLKMLSVEYIVENSTQVLSSPNWPQWVKINSTIASEVFLKLSNKFDSSSKSITV